MRKTFVVVAIFVTALMAIPETTAAQNRSYGGYGIVGYQEAVMIASARRQCRQMRQMGIDSLHCQQLGIFPNNRQMGVYNPYGWRTQNFQPPYGPMLQYPFQGQYMGSLGRVVPNAGSPYFDALVVPCQVLSGRQRKQKFIAKVVTGFIGGLAAGMATDHPKTGIAIGTGLGTAWALADDSNFCEVPQPTQLPVQQTEQFGQSTAAILPPERVSTPSVEQASIMVPQPVASLAVDPLANITWLTVNTTDFWAVVTDPNRPVGDPEKVKLISKGGSLNLHDPAGEQSYTVVLLEPGRGKSNQVPGEIRPSEDLSGWEIIAR